MPLFRGSCITLVFPLLLTGVVVKMDLVTVSPSPETPGTWWGGVTQTSEATSESISQTSLASTSPSVSPTANPVSPSVSPTSDFISSSLAPTSDSISPSVSPTSDSISPSVSPTSDSISPSVSPTSDSISPSVSPTSDSISPSVSPTSDSISPSVSPTSDSISPSVSPTSDFISSSLAPTSDSISPTVSPTSESTSPSETTSDEGSTTALPPHMSSSHPGLESSSTEIFSTHRGWASAETETGTRTRTGTDQPLVTSAAVSSSSEIGGLVHHLDGRQGTRTPATSHAAPSSTEKTGEKRAGFTPSRSENATRRNLVHSTVRRAYETPAAATTEAPSRTISLVGYCLIVIAVLAGVCTFFVVTTVVLCIKLSNQRRAYRMRSRSATELVCISKLLPDDRANPRRKNNRYEDEYFKNKMNIFNCDSEDDGLTLQSFVTEH